MWQRFTEKARRVIFFAQEEAAMLGQTFVGTEHLLLGLVREDDNVAARVLERLGVDAPRVREKIEKMVMRGGGRLGQDMQLTPRAKRVMDLAHEEARQRNNDYVGTEHLLLALAREEDGIAGRVLARLGVTLEAAREVVGEVQEAAPNQAAPEGLDRLPPRLLDLLTRWLPSVAAEAAREHAALEDVLRAQWEKALEACRNAQPEAFEDPSRVAPAPKPEREAAPPPEPPPPFEGTRPPVFPPDRERAIFQVAIAMARRQGSREALRAMLQEALDALDRADDEPA